MEWLRSSHAISANGTEGKSHATIRVRWRGTVEPGDELQLFGLLGPIAPPRNPGELICDPILPSRYSSGVVVRYPRTPHFSPHHSNQF
jgi:hypothetical protein